jgi:5'-nucleotidase (lipoprotein e(P4) family)
MHIGTFIRIVMNRFFLSALILISCHCWTIKGEKLPNDIRWVTQSKEYTSLCIQTYQLAQSVVLPKLKKGKGNLAIVMDLDETVLDNSNYQVERAKLNLGFTQESWSGWVKRKEADLVPGAKAFISKTRAFSIRLVFISNRMDYNLAPTRENLVKLGILSPDDIFLLRRNKEDTKDKRREEVLTGKGRMSKVGPLEVVAYFGDAMGDFPSLAKGNFGETKFILPNPMYGKW